MTRHEIAIKKHPFDCVIVSRKTIVLKKWGPISLEKSPCSATCKRCSGIIPAKTLRFKVIDPWKKYCMTRLYHEHCLPNDLLEIIKKKEKALS